VPVIRTGCSLLWRGLAVYGGVVLLGKLTTWAAAKSLPLDCGVGSGGAPAYDDWPMTTPEQGDQVHQGPRT
jgi:hypothetical protein